MKTIRLVFVPIFAIFFAIFTGCSKQADPTLSNRQKNPALQSALDELTRMKSFTEAGLSFTEYSDRLLTAKANIDVALKRTNDNSAISRINDAVGFYLKARDAWKEKIDNKYAEVSVEEYWVSANDASIKAAEYAFADDSTRRELDKQWDEEKKKAKDELNKELAAESKVEEAEDQAKKQQEARELQADRDRQAKEEQAERKRQAEVDRKEKERRFAPEGTGFNIAPISVATVDTLAVIAPGTELKVSKNPDGTLHVQSGEFAADVPTSQITNDRDLAAAVRSGEKSKDDALLQWRAQQEAASQQTDADERARENAASASKETPY